MTTRVTSEGITVIRADEGKWLQKGEAYSNTDIYIGIRDNVANWTEVATEPVPAVEQTPDDIINELEELV